VSYNSKPAARDGDSVCCGTTLTDGSQTVSIGDSPGQAPAFALAQLPAIAMQLISQIGNILGQQPFGPQPGQPGGPGQPGPGQPGPGQPGQPPQQPPPQQPPPGMQVIPPDPLKVDDGSAKVIKPDPVKADPPKK